MHKLLRFVLREVARMIRYVLSDSDRTIRAVVLLAAIAAWTLYFHLSSGQ
jgi:hypothetical protein